VDEEAYAYDRAGNILSQTSTRLGSASSSETQCFTYDSLDRMTAAWTATDSCAAQPSSSNSAMVGDNLGASSAYWTTWAFDVVGNRTSQVQHSTTGGTDTTTSYSYNGNGAGQPGTLTSTSTTGGSTGSTSYAYDSAGDMTSRNAGPGNQSLTWNDAGLLTSITGGTGGNSSFVYDADGNLLLEKDPGATTLYLPGEQITLNTATQATSGVRYYSLPGGGMAYRTGSGNAYGFEITDLHGTPVLTLDNTAQIPTWRQFTPYGAPRGTAVTWIDNRGFLDKPTDTNTGLTAIGAREYDPTTGRFISLDPILETTVPQELNGYTYAANNPVTNADPSGLMLCADNVCGSIQWLEHYFSSQGGGGGGGSSGGGGGGGGGGSSGGGGYGGGSYGGGYGGGSYGGGPICYYCYAPQPASGGSTAPARPKAVMAHPPLSAAYMRLINDLGWADTAGSAIQGAASLNHVAHVVAQCRQVCQLADRLAGNNWASDELAAKAAATSGASRGLLTSTTAAGRNFGAAFDMGNVASRWGAGLAVVGGALSATAEYNSTNGNIGKTIAVGVGDTAINVVGGAAGGVVGAMVTGAIAGSWAGPAGMIVGGLVGAGIAYFGDTAWNSFVNLF